MPFSTETYKRHNLATLVKRKSLWSGFQHSAFSLQLASAGDTLGRYKKSGAATGMRCMRCQKAAAQAWPLEVVSQRSADSEFAKEVSEVMSRYDGSLDKSFVRQSYHQNTVTGHLVEARFKVYDEKLCNATFETDAKKFGLQAEVLTDHRGCQLAGYLVKELGPLEVRAYHACLGELSLLLQRPETQLRAHQAEEFSAACQEDLRRSILKGYTVLGRLSLVIS